MCTPLGVSPGLALKGASTFGSRCCHSWRTSCSGRMVSGQRKLCRQHIDESNTSGPYHLQSCSLAGDSLQPPTGWFLARDILHQHVRSSVLLLNSGERFRSKSFMDLSSSLMRDLGAGPVSQHACTVFSCGHNMLLL